MLLGGLGLEDTQLLVELTGDVATVTDDCAAGATVSGSIVVGVSRGDCLHLRVAGEIGAGAAAKRNLNMLKHRNHNKEGEREWIKMGEGGKKEEEEEEEG